MALALMLASGCGGSSSTKVDAKAEPLSAESKAAFQAQLDEANSAEKAQQSQEKANNKSKDAPSAADSEERSQRRN